MERAIFIYEIYKFMIFQSSQKNQNFFNYLRKEKYSNIILFFVQHQQHDISATHARGISKYYSMTNYYLC